jgi:predicted helicase
MGNPPYSGHSKNHGKWIDDLLHGTAKDQSVSSYYHVDGEPLGERNPKWLQDDYVKFICFGQSRIERSGQGVLAYITNHGFLDNPTFRGMRQSLMKTFSEIYVLDLHGSVKKRARKPAGKTDQNVFDIQQGVSIGIFIKRPGNTELAKVFHADLWGSRAEKYQWLFENHKGSTKWASLAPQGPFYLFKPLDTTGLATYQAAWKITDIFPVNVLGFQTHRDAFAVGFDRAGMEARFRDMRSNTVSDEEFRDRFKLCDNEDWTLAAARTAIKADDGWQNALVNCLYRPFDWRTCYFSEVAMDRPRHEIREHVLGRDNLCLLTSRQQADVGFTHALVTQNPAESCAVSNKTKEQNYVFPLYAYPETDSSKKALLDEAPAWPADPENDGRTPNLSAGFINALASAIGLEFSPVGVVPEKRYFNPSNVFDYIYAMLHSRSYRETYSHFLRLDFPRIPLPSSAKEFFSVAELGRQLRSLHLLDDTVTIPPEVRFPVAGDNIVARAHPKFVSQEDGGLGWLYINKTQYFEGITAEVWEFEIGSYQVLEKWLKDRKGRQLSYEDLTHYQRVIGAVYSTLSAMEALDQLIDF